MERSLKTSQLLVTLILSLPFLSSVATDVRSVTHKWRGEPLHNTFTFQGCKDSSDYDRLWNTRRHYYSRPNTGSQHYPLLTPSEPNPQQNTKLGITLRWPRSYRWPFLESNISPKQGRIRKRHFIQKLQTKKTFLWVETKIANTDRCL